MYQWIAQRFYVWRYEPSAAAIAAIAVIGHGIE